MALSWNLNVSGVPYKIGHAWAKALREALEQGSGVTYGSMGTLTRERMRERAFLRRWLYHRSLCAVYQGADRSCDCGLQALLDEVVL